MADDELFERMVAEGHAAFTLASMGGEAEPRNQRERELVEAAVVAGVVGTLNVIRRVGPDTG